MNQGPRSLSHDAWRRLCCNPLAMLAGCFLLAIIAACLLLPPLLPHDPSEQRSWIGSRPPGSLVVDARDENRFVVGLAAEAPARAVRAQRIDLVYLREEYEDYVITLRRGLVQMIQRERGGMLLDALHLEQGSLHRLQNDKPVGADLIGLSLRPGDALPPSLQEAGRRFMLRHTGASKEHQIRIQLLDGIVSSITDEDEAVSSLTVQGSNILHWTADGRLLQQRYLLGSDRLGRDVLTRVLHGGRISLLVGLVATVVSVSIGVLYGLLAGYVGGRTDRLMMAFIDILYAIPFLFLVILLLVSFQRSLLMLFIALGAVQWLTMARIIRGQTLSLRHREFIEAAELCGARHHVIILRHLLPNCLGTIIVYATLTVPLVILQESFLAFIGLQVELGDGRALDSWGSLVRQGMQSLDTQAGDRWWLLVFPACTMALTLLALNIFGDGLRDACDPRLRGAA